VRRTETQGLLLQLSNLPADRVVFFGFFSFLYLYPCNSAKTTFLFFLVIIESVLVVLRLLGENFDVARIRKEASFPSCRSSIGKTSHCLGPQQQPH
jgi:hypothetical protein